MNLSTAFADSANRAATKIALFWGDREISYSELRRQSDAIAQILQHDRGVQAGDRVGIWLKNCPEFVPVLLGILQAGAVAVPINNFLKPQEVEHILADAQIRVLFSDTQLAPSLAPIQSARPELAVLTIDPWPTPTAGIVRPDAPPSLAQEDDLAIIIYTSGTTGRPKGAMLTHGNLLHNVESCRCVLEAISADRFVVLLPMFHSFMLTVGILLPLRVGGSIVLIKSLHPPKNILHEIMAHQGTILPAIPAFFRTLASAAAAHPLPLRVCISGAAPLPGEILKEFNERVQIPLIEGYGLSEASPVCSLNPIHGPRKAGSIGLPIAHVEMSIQNDRGDLLPDGEMGEICIRGGNVMRGYWNQPEESARAMRGSWLLTGDVGYRDSDGYYFITDRKKDMLLVNGINVYPREIEEILYQFPGVKEAAVIGIPDPRKGEQPVAFVSATENTVLDERALLAFVRQRLADYKVPRRIHFLPNLPRNATGKILKTALREQAR